ncbi:MAG: glutamyl-tRNA reductase [Desulfobulbaceae bacterium]|uniref:Glutamyl-tRNA reductase n=1 Tax=Candidatus Desulfobia pelagia TaxID=2841692 RepID=A0A8J6NHS8_9BACT|nr:glutamyl-tRNA reductase [Candidatus Desulfobia pelagia]
MSADSIFVLGVNHKTAPIKVREQLAFTDDPEAPFRHFKSIEGCEEFCFLSTCNRVEVIFTTPRKEETIRDLRKFLFQASNLSDEESAKYTYLHHGSDAITHIYRVSSSLDSMIVGEPQILGQLKDAYRQSSDRDCTSVILNRLLHKAFSVAKRIRTETNIGGSAVSISYAAVELAKKIFGDISGKKVLLIGAGEMAELAAEHLVTQGITEVIVANRTLENAVLLAQRFKGTPVGLNEILDQLETVDIVISSTGASGLILHQKEVKPIMPKRRNRPLFMIDIAVPRDLDPELNNLDNVYLYDVDDLTHVVESNKSERVQEATKAERIVVEETLKFLQWLDNMELTPTITAMRQKADTIARTELAKTLSHIELPAKDKKSIEKMACAIVNKLLHDPILHLKDSCRPDEKQKKIAHARRLFSLDNDNQILQNSSEENRGNNITPAGRKCYDSEE